ncbi:MAG TPA: DUF6249 domain-containing protein [Burkholderiaceae bacterium]|nr:DUF6249 domain-containing protein [Burkholderiaceae bacterium]
MDLTQIPKILGVLLPFLGILLPLLIIVALLWFKERQRAALYDTVRHFADRGMPVPRELLEPPPARGGGAANTPRMRAFTQIGAGAGLALLFWSLEMHNLIGIGGLVACVGLAQLWALTLDERDARRRDGTPE